MTPEEVPGLLEAISARVASAAPGMAMAMGETHKNYLTGVTLSQSGAHGPARPSVPGYPRAAPEGAPPAQMTGTLRRSITAVRGPGSGVTGSSRVAPHTDYANTLEHGGVHSGDMFLWLKYIGRQEVLRRGWRRREVTLKAHPYMRPSRDAVIANGSVTSAANAAFMERVWG